MPKVKIYKLNNNGDQELLATCFLQSNGLVVCQGPETFVHNLKEKGILDYGNPERPKLFPKDGLKFLEQLKNNFKSAYLSATEVLSE